MQPKTARNNLIVKQIEAGKSFQDVAEMFGLKAKSTVHHIYKRAKKSVRSYPQARLVKRS